jgi:hypothetical protein
MMCLAELAGGYVLPPEVAAAELVQQLARSCVRAITYGRDLARSPGEWATALVRGERCESLLGLVAVERELQPGPAFDAALRLVNHEARTLFHLGALVASHLVPVLPCLPRHVEALLRFHRVQLENAVHAHL